MKLTKNKKITLGVLVAVSAIAIPVATVVSCGSKNESSKNESSKINTHVQRETFEASYSDMSNYKLFSGSKKLPSRTQGTTKDNGEKVYHQKVKVTFSDEIMRQLKLKYKNKSKMEKVDLHLDIKASNMYGDILTSMGLNQNDIDWLNTNDFFKTYKNSKGITTPKKLIEFELVIPKWFNDFNSLDIEHVGNKDNIYKINASALDKGKIKLLSLEESVTTFDPSNLPQGLKTLDLNLKTINSFNSFDFPQELQNLYIGPRGLIYRDPFNITFDASNLPKGLKELSIQRISLSTLDTSKLPRGLKALWLSHDELSSFDSFNLPKGLEELDLSVNSLPSFDSSNLPKGLTKLNISSNKLAKLNTSNLPKGLTDLDFGGNHITTFDSSNLPKGLTDLDFGWNNITTFDSSNLPKGLTNLDLNNNKLTSFDPYNLPQGIERLNISDNNLDKKSIEKLKKFIKQHTGSKYNISF